jgi:hypothetical protein
MGDSERDSQSHSAPNVLIPGSGSLRDLLAVEAPRRLHWRSRSLYVPRMPFVAGSVGGRIQPKAPIGVPSGWKTRYGRKIHNSIVETLAGHRPLSHEWTAHELAQELQFHYAAVRDLADVKLDDTARDKAARKGREMWAAIGAWPWSCFSPDGQLPKDWRQLEFVVLAWQGWLGVPDD